MARFLPDISNGGLTMSLAFLEDAIDWGPNGVGLVAQPNDGGYTLNGIKRFVPFGQSVDRIVVASRLPGTSGADGITLVSVPSDAAGLTIEANVMLDLNAKMATLVFDNVSVAAADVIGAPGAAWPTLDATLQRAAVGAAAEMLGASRKSLEMSVEYAKVRRQFGQVIGQFQAIKHKLSEMLEQVENAHAAVYYAAWAIDAGAPDAVLASSVAKATLNEASRNVCGEAVQVHGGIGFTWEYDLHLYFKRAKNLEPLYGDTDFHRERVLEEVLAGRVAGKSEPVAV
jgi:alkylation response protein AidB-like acyl-CoA dehydrogenase